MAVPMDIPVVEDKTWIPCTKHQRLRRRQRQGPCSKHHSVITNRKKMNLSFLVILIVWMSILLVSANYDDDYDYVNEVLEDSYEDMEGEDRYYETDPQDTTIPNNEQQQQDDDEEERLRQQKQEQEEEIERLRLQEEKEKFERIQQERERAFEMELQRMNEEQQKIAKKKKKKDSKIVSQILKAAKKKNHYGVLGLYNMEIQIQPKIIKLGASFPRLWRRKKKNPEENEEENTASSRQKFWPLTIRIPGFTLFPMTNAKIRKAYRNRALLVHPDKNFDGRANEAFFAIEDSSSLLSNEETRREYDESIRLYRQQIKQSILNKIQSALQSLLYMINYCIHIFKTFLGPFAFPVFIIGALII